MTEFSQPRPPIEHVAQPADTELCFAACIASALGRDAKSLSAINRALAEKFISDETGAASPPWEPVQVDIWFQDRIGYVRLETTYGIDEQSPAGAYAAVTASLERGERIALVHQKTADPNSGMHWVLLADGQLMDPLQEEAIPLADEVLRDIIDQSTEGVYAVSIQV